jgi:hypothetical protein
MSGLGINPYYNQNDYSGEGDSPYPYTLFPDL